MPCLRLVYDTVDRAVSASFFSGRPKITSIFQDAVCRVSDKAPAAWETKQSFSLGARRARSAARLTLARRAGGPRQSRFTTRAGLTTSQRLVVST